MTDFGKLAVFKTIPGGYVYQAPNKWVFGSHDHYLVNDTQKAIITKTLTAASRTVVFTTIAVWSALSLLLAGGPILWASRAGYRDPGLGGLLVMITVLLSGVIAILISRQFLRHRLKPALAALPRTDEHITSAEALEAMRHVSTAALSPGRRRLIRICCPIAGGGALISIFVPAIDGRALHPSWSVAQALYETNFTFSGLLNVVSLIAFGYLFWFYGRVPTDKPAAPSKR